MPDNLSSNPAVTDRGRIVRKSGENFAMNLRDVVGGALNPVWIEWLMGFPLGWTDLQPLATDKFRQWLHSHGAR